MALRDCRKSVRLLHYSCVCVTVCVMFHQPSRKRNLTSLLREDRIYQFFHRSCFNTLNWLNIHILISFLNFFLEFALEQLQVSGQGSGVEAYKWSKMTATLVISSNHPEASSIRDQRSAELQQDWHNQHPICWSAENLPSRDNWY